MMQTARQVNFDDMAHKQEPYQTDKARWAAVSARVAEADGAFVYAVRTTGVYCRPSCPSRPALLKNIEFFDNTKAATKAGFRACKRCRPEAGSTYERNNALITKACRIIDEAETPPSLDALAQTIGLSKHHFHRLFKNATGLTPKAYANASRDEKMRAALASNNSVTTAIYDAGFNSSGRFYEKSNKALGMTPTKRRARGKGEQINFAVGECSLGTILVASTTKGVCSITLGDEPEEMIDALQEQFANAELIGDDKKFDAYVAKIVGFLDDPQAGLDLPLDIRGTAFQRKVWAALIKIPTGTTLSYSELAAKLGAPKSSRAVAGACAANKIALAIPCHRVVRSDGGLSGYRWGVERKRALLDRERD